jgi:hypothetical protein
MASSSKANQTNILMPQPELAHLELLAEVDTLLAELEAWAERAPQWPPARHCRALVERLIQRTATLRVRLEAPLVVATLGGTGTGKSALVNAIVGAIVVESGRERPTTRQPTLICRSDLAPESLGIDPQAVHVVTRDFPSLRDLVLLDCPDPDTTEDPSLHGTNLARLRELLPHCDVLLVTSTQQKYRSARVASELASAAPGARLVFVQTHADVDDDIRDDWRGVLADEYATGQMFLIDSPAALADQQAGIQPRGEFARLLDLLTRELAGTAGQRIRRANFLDLVAELLAACRERIDSQLPAITQLEQALIEQRSRLAARLAEQIRTELSRSRRPWEKRLVGEVAERWGLSPFSALLRIYNGVGGILSSAALLRVRTPAQMALWGAWEAGRAVRRRGEQQQADSVAARALTGTWDETELRTAAIIIDGYAAEAGLRRDETQLSSVSEQAAEAGGVFVAQAASELQALISRLAAGHTGLLTRVRYELLLTAMLVLLLYRLGRNFFWDSWFGAELGFRETAAPMLGLDFLLTAAFWLLLWCGLLLWMFTARLRKGLQGEINRLAERWNTPQWATGIFSALDRQCRAVHQSRSDLEQLELRITALKQRVETPEPTLGHRLN